VEIIKTKNQGFAVFGIYKTKTEIESGINVFKTNGFKTEGISTLKIG